VRRRVSLDFELPSETFADVLNLSEEASIVPLTFLAKRADGDAVLRSFDIRDSDNRCLSVLGMEEGRMAALAMLSTAVKRMSGVATLQEEDVDELWAIVTLPPEAAGERAKAIIDRTGVNGAMASVPDTSLELLGFLLDWFSNHFVLLAVIGAGGQRCRRVVKLAYDEGLPRKAQIRRGNRWSTIKTVMGWGSLRIDPDFTLPLPCRSLHFEVEAPSQMMVTKALTRVVRWEEGPGSSPGATTRRIHQREEVDGNRSHYPALAHVRQPGISFGYAFEPSFEIDFARGGSSSLVLWACLLLTVGLSAGVYWPHRLLQPEAAATMLVLAPGLLSGAAIFTGQHSALSLLRAGFRVLVGALGVISLVAAATLVSLPDSAGPERETFLRPVWSRLFLMSVAISILLLPAVYFRRKRG
jgi:hypothetical protein